MCTSGHTGNIKERQRGSEKNIYLVIGGFHLLQKSESETKEIINEFKKLGVMKCGATHCTGEKQIKIFKESYGENYVEMGTGRTIMIK